MQPQTQSDAFKALTELNSKALTASTAELYDEVVKLLAGLTASVCDLYLVRGQSNQLELMATSREDRSELKSTIDCREQGILELCQAIETRTPVMVTDPAVAAYLPVEGVDGMLGVLALHPAESSELRQTALETGMLMVTILAQAIELRRRQQQINEQGQKIEALDAELTAIVYAVSHDLDAPIRAIQGFSAALVEDYADQLGAEGEFYARRLEAAGDQVEQMTQALISLSRVAQSPLHSKRVDLSSLAEEIRQELSLLHPEHQIDWRIEPGLYAMGDMHLLRKLLNALFENAVRFTMLATDRNPTISFHAVPASDEPTFVIQDNGIGFDMRHLERLFKPFQRLHADSEIDGSGMGLAIASRIVHRHQGQIWAESRPNEGTSITFTLPISDR